MEGGAHFSGSRSAELRIYMEEGEVTVITSARMRRRATVLVLSVLSVYQYSANIARFYAQNKVYT